MFKAILNLYKRNRITKAGVANAVVRGVITAEQYEEIVGEVYA